MKRITIIFLCLLFISPILCHAQFDKLKKKSEKKAEKALDKGMDNLFGNKKEENKKESGNQLPAEQPSDNKGPEQPAGQSESTDNKLSKPVLSWAKYDFIPGDNIIFEDNLINEENGEFPSRWDLQRGTAEIAQFGGENVIFLRGGAPCIVPYMKNSTEDYLPDVFTIEFDIYFGYGYADIYLYDRKNQKPSSGSGEYKLTVAYDHMDIGSFSSKLPQKVEKERWAHVSIAYTNGKLKAYLDDTRLINIPRLSVNPTGFSVYSYHAKDDQPIYIKNIRLAEGGVKYYDRFLQDGKIISNAIRFDVGKATLKPESMGAINEIYTLLKEHPEINFSIEGHTDSDGDNTMNLQLSQRRAETVKNKLIEMGIDSSRLTSKGLGETMPLASNDTPESKANNRRVEFVKID